MKTLAEWHEFTEIGDERGALCSIESFNNLPFAIERIYYIYNTASGVTRGFHAHHELDQVLIAISGSCKVKLDDGIEAEHVVLNSRLKGLKMPPMLWHEMYGFSEDCVLLCLASQHYDEADYIRNYDEFKKIQLDRNTKL